MKLPYPAGPIWGHVRQHPIFYSLALLCLLGYQGTRYYGEWSARQLECNTLNLPKEVLPGSGPLRIGLFSDLHNNRELFEETISRLEAARPDLIIFGGDFILVNERFLRSRWAVEGLRRLVAIAPTFAILGNQDYEKQEQVERVFKTAGVTLLRNEAVNWQTPSGNTLRIVGLGDFNEGDEAPEKCMVPLGTAQTPVLLLSHDPESRNLVKTYDWDLMLSGHTHGGQLGNPFTGEFISFRSSMPAGLFSYEGGRHVFVTRGVGAIYAMRFFCPPELNIINIGQPQASPPTAL